MKTKKIYVLLLTAIFGLLTNQQVKAQTFTAIATDIAGDGFDASLLDGTSLEYYYDQASDSITFRVTVTNFSTNQQAVGVNIMVNIPGGGQTFNFWGDDNMNPFHRLITTWVTGTPANYTGTVGIADNVGVGASNFTNLSSNNIDISLGGMNQIHLKVKRSDLIPDSYFGTNNTITCVTAAAVGSNQAWNDDIYSSTGTMTINKGFPSSTKNITKQNVLPLNLYPNPAADNVFISADKDFKNAEISVFNQFGQLVKKVSNVSGSSFSLETTSLSAGFYMINASQQNSSYTSKFTINK